MLEWMKDYQHFREKIRDVKLEQFEELRRLLDENQRLAHESADLKAKHEREVMTLAHQLQLEKERFGLERERVISETKTKLFEDRERFLEKNFSDLERTLTKQHDATRDILGMVMDRLPNVKWAIGDGSDVSVNVRDHSTRALGKAPDSQ
jgi:hypothetical protein